MIFGQLLTTSNYDDTMDRTTGGRNGYGAKLTNIFSKEFTIETVDAKQGKKYKQIFRNNLSITEEPKITNCSDKPYTKITFIPDMNLFQLKTISDDFYCLMVKRVYDIAQRDNRTI